MDQQEKQIPCENCEKLFPESKLDLHEAYCIRNIKKCDQCSEYIDKSEMEAHFDAKHKKVECKYCHVNLEPTLIESHQNKFCIKRPRECQFCGVQVPSNGVQEHEEKCGSKTKICGKCEKYVTVKEFDNHTISCPGKVQQPQYQANPQYESHFSSQTYSQNGGLTKVSTNISVNNNTKMYQYSSTTNQSKPVQNSKLPVQQKPTQKKPTTTTTTTTRKHIQSKNHTIKKPDIKSTDQKSNANSNNNNQDYDANQFLSEEEQKEQALIYEQLQSQIKQDKQGMQYQQQIYQQEFQYNNNNPWLNGQVDPSQMGESFYTSQDPELQKALMESINQRNIGQYSQQGTSNKPQGQQPISYMIPKNDHNEDEWEIEDPELAEVIERSKLNQ